MNWILNYRIKLQKTLMLFAFPFKNDSISNEKIVCISWNTSKSPFCSMGAPQWERRYSATSADPFLDNLQQNSNNENLKRKRQCILQLHRSNINRAATLQQ
jgi:hypothetical protein